MRLPVSPKGTRNAQCCHCVGNLQILQMCLGAKNDVVFCMSDMNLPKLLTHFPCVFPKHLCWKYWYNRRPMSRIPINIISMEMWVFVVGFFCVYNHFLDFSQNICRGRQSCELFVQSTRAPFERRTASKLESCHCFCNVWSPVVLVAAALRSRRRVSVCVRFVSFSICCVGTFRCLISLSRWHRGFCQMVARWAIVLPQKTSSSIKPKYGGNHKNHNYSKISWHDFSVKHVPNDVNRSI